jgi:hypothetical protein
MVDLPAGKDVTLKLAHWPCNSAAIGFRCGERSRSWLQQQADARTQHDVRHGDGGKGDQGLQTSPACRWYTLTPTADRGAIAPAATTTTTTTTRLPDDQGTTTLRGHAMTTTTPPRRRGGAPWPASDSLNVQTRRCSATAAARPAGTT